MIIIYFFLLFLLISESLSQFVCPCCCQVYAPLCGTIFPPSLLRNDIFSSSVGRLGSGSGMRMRSPLLSGGCHNSIPLQGCCEEVDMATLVGDLVEYKDQSNIINEMVKGQDFNSFNKDTLDILLKTYSCMHALFFLFKFIFLFWLPFS